MYPHPKHFIDGDGTLHLNAGDYGETIEVACFTPGGERLLTVREVGVAQVWDVASGALLGVIRPSSPLEHSDAGPTAAAFQVFIEAAALSPDGCYALLGLNDGTAGIFDVVTGERRCILYDPAVPPASRWDLVRAVAYSPDGRHVAVGFFGRAVGIWDAAGVQLQAFLRGVDSREITRDDGPRPTLISSLCFSADGRYLCAGYADGAITIWECDNGQPALEAYEHVEAFVGLWLGDNVSRWATNAGTVWESRGDRVTRLLQTHEPWIAANFSRDGGALVATTVAGFQRWDLSAGTIEHTPHHFPPGRSRAILRAQYGPSGSMHVLPLSSHRLLLAAPSHEVELLRTGQLGALAFSADGTRLVTASSADQLEVWSTDGACLQVLLVDGVINGVTLSADGRLVAAAVGPARDGATPRAIWVWRVDDKALLSRLVGHTARLRALGFGPEGHWLAGVCEDQRVYRWNLEPTVLDECAPAIALEREQLRSEHLAVLSDGRVLVFRQTCIEVWDGLGELLATVPATLRYNAIWAVNGSEDRLAVSDWGQQVAVWSLADGSQIGRHAPPVLRPMELFTTDILLALMPMASAAVWAGPGGPYVALGDGPRGWATPLPLSPERTQLAIPGRDAAGLIALETPPRLIQRVPFAGRMRAGCITTTHVLLLNDTGELYVSERIR